MCYVGNLRAGNEAPQVESAMKDIAQQLATFRPAKADWSTSNTEEVSQKFKNLS